MRDCRVWTHHSVATLLDAMADPQPNVLKQESTIFPASSTCSVPSWSGCLHVKCTRAVFEIRECQCKALHEQTKHANGSTHPYLQLHHVSAGGGTYKPSSHVHIFLVKGAHVPGLLIMIDHLQDSTLSSRIAYV